MQNNRYTLAQSGEKAIDAGLRAHMLSVYNRMTMGVLVTALTSFLVSSSPALLKLFLGGPQAYLIMFGPLLVLWFGFRPDRMSSRALMTAFLAISVLYGISFSVIFLAFAGETIARAFFVASGMFAGLSIYGYTTKKNLTALGTFVIMGIWGIFIASILNLFFASPLMQNVIAAVGIIAFSGMTAWQTQMTKQTYSPSHGLEMNSRMAWAAALNLYISFIALFQYILHFMNQQR
ncbi:MAG: Bax inhibitor-1/YccA family protein [Alphaproteobacteria bacterium]|nr:Bax inhibitor-1/YccA family protein [Alphaproteobacteria bacterium]